MSDTASIPVQCEATPQGGAEQFGAAHGSAPLGEITPRAASGILGAGGVRKFEAEGVTLYLGDCKDIVPLLSFDAVVTDPPYGVNHNPGSGRMSKIGKAIMGDLAPPELRWMAAHPAVVWGGNNFCDQLPRSTGWLVWDKTHAKTCEHSQAELAWTNTVRTVRLHREAYHGFMRQRDGWFHTHQKPVNLMAWAMTWLPQDVTVLDPYMGSGTTGLAAIRTGRRFIGIELDPEHFENAVQRVRSALAQGVLSLGGGGGFSVEPSAAEKEPNAEVSHECPPPASTKEGA